MKTKIQKPKKIICKKCGSGYTYSTKDFIVCRKCSHRSKK